MVEAGRLEGNPFRSGRNTPGQRDHAKEEVTRPGDLRRKEASFGVRGSQLHSFGTARLGPQPIACDAASTFHLLWSTASGRCPYRQPR
jgi:hypothetical protein